VNIFTKQYDGESMVDVFRDVSEACDERFTPALATIPRDEHGFHKGTFKVSIVWQDDEPAAPATADEAVSETEKGWRRQLDWANREKWLVVTFDRLEMNKIVGLLDKARALRSGASAQPADGGAK